MNQTNVFKKEAGNVIGNLGHGVVELGRFTSTSQKVTLINTFRKNGFKVILDGNDLVVTTA